MKDSNYILEVGFTLLFIVKKWYEGQGGNEGRSYQAPATGLQGRLQGLKECALQPSNQNHMVSDATTFFKDLVLGFVTLCRSKFPSSCRSRCQGGLHQ